jgi:hypothetical protein
MTALTKKQQNTLRSLHVRTQAFLLYPHEIPYAEHLIGESRSIMENCFGLDKQAEFIVRLGDCRSREVEETKSKIAASLRGPEDEVVITDAQEATVHISQLPPLAESILKYEEIAWDRESVIEDVDSGIDDDGDGVEMESVEALPFTLEDGKVMLIRPSRHVTIYDEYSNNLERIRASSLKVGQTLVVINSSVSKSLAEVLIERIEHHSKMFETVALQRMWIETLLKGMEREGDTPTTLLKKIQQRGSKIQTSVAVHFWRKGEVIGPQDKEDIRIIGEIYDEKSLLSNLDKVWTAIKRLRSIHRQLAYNLRYLLPQYGTASRSTNGNMDFVVDRDLNLYIEDFKDAISLERVISVEPTIRVPHRYLSSKIDRSTMKELASSACALQGEAQ